MRILGIDYGQKKIGLALATSKIAEPFGVIKFVDWQSFLERLVEIVTEEKAEKIVIGISEAKSARETRAFGEKLAKEISLPIEYFDETLSTQEAQKLSREANISRKKRTAMEDAYAAAIMLQNCLDLKL